MTYGLTPKQVESLNEVLRAIAKPPAIPSDSEFYEGIDYAVYHIEGFLRALQTINRITDERGHE